MNAYLLLPLIQTLFCLVLIVIVLRGRLRSFAHRLFSFFLLGLATWGIVIFGMRASPDIEHAYSWERCLIPLGPLISVLFYHFSVHYTGTKIKKWCLPLLYVVCLCFIPLATTDFVFSGMQIKPYGYAPIFGSAGAFHVLFSMGVQLIALLTFIKTYRTSFYAEERNRAAYVSIGVIFAAVGAIFDALPIFGLPLYPGLIIGNIIFCSLVTVAIVRHNLLDIHVVLRKGTAYVLTSAVIAIPFIAIFLLATKVFKEGDFPSWAYFIVAIVLAFALPHLWQWVQQWVERWFYRDRYDHFKALGTFSRQTQSLSGSARLGSTMVNLLAKALRSSNVYLLQPLPRSRDFTTTFSTSVNNATPIIRLKKGGALVKWLEHSNSILSHGDIEIIPQLQGITSEERQTLQQVGAELIVPLKASTAQLSGVLILGEKLSEQPYTSEDKQLIYTICNHMSTNLENVRLYSESQQEVRERKQAEEALRESKELFEKTFTNQRDAIFILDAKSPPIIVACNPAAMEMFGYTHQQEVLGHTTAFLHVDEPALRKFQEYLNPAIEKHGFFHLPEFKMKKKDGTVFPTEHSVAALKDQEGKRIGWVSLVRDITERKRAEEELKQSHEQLRNLSAHIESAREAERTSIARKVHDELGQALTALKMDMSWLNKRLPKEQEALIKRTEAMSRIIDTTIQTVKRISTELRPGVLDDLGLMAAIEWQVQEFQERTGIKCELTAESEDIKLERDLATRVFRILQEALTNVARHANATRVKVSLEERDEQLVLQVRDNGKGITGEQIAHPRSFGLIGMRERARSWNGSVKIGGIPGKGTIVKVNIPLN